MSWPGVAQAELEMQRGLVTEPQDAAEDVVGQRDIRTAVPLRTLPWGRRCRGTRGSAKRRRGKPAAKPPAGTGRGGRGAGGRRDAAHPSQGQGLGFSVPPARLPIGRS